MAYSCPDCAKSFRDASGLRRHVSSVHLKERPFRCQQCEDTFGTQWSLERHVRIRHENLRPHRCELCEASFHQAGDLKKHLESHAKRRKLGVPRETTVANWLEGADVSFERGVRVDFRDGEEPLFARVDFLVRQPWGLVALEVDEHQHKLRDTEREARRMRRIRAALSLAKVVRYNPDEFTVDGRAGEVTANERHRRLLDSLAAAPEAGFEEVRLFYDEGPEATSATGSAGVR
ncbi:ZNF236 [Symbiodinium natans]|uniref:ZNF236 protein n=1 Tax=Symbiodinium natans TaxID=878477 RepID=A0A812Q1J9_9DINO|nr:ZNF236 [Symbiodinium natans]